jgi:hypothetical protein
MVQLPAYFPNLLIKIGNIARNASIPIFLNAASEEVSYPLINPP